MATMCVLLLMANCRVCGKWTWHVATSKGLLDCLECRARGDEKSPSETNLPAHHSRGDTRDEASPGGVPSLIPTTSEGGA